MSEAHGEVLISAPEHCRCCGKILSGAHDVEMMLRQVFDVPLLKLTCTEQRAMKRPWRRERVTKAPFAPNARATIYYKANSRAVALYLLFGQFLPVERATDALYAKLDVEISTGFLCSLAEETASNLESFSAKLRGVLAAEPFICVDETPHEVRRAIWWIHTVASEQHHYLFASLTPGKAAPDTAGVLAGFTRIMVHYRLSMYSSYAGAAHDLCNTHVARNLAALAEISAQGWAPAMALTLSELNAATDDTCVAGRSAIPRHSRLRLVARYEKLVADAFGSTYPASGHERDALEPKARNLIMGFYDRKPEITRFATELGVPFTNNTARRFFIMPKVHRKVTECFKSESHTRHLATIRSYLDTARTHVARATDVLAALSWGTFSILRRSA